jgi:phenol 2-monooxygenase (NADPH)
LAPQLVIGERFPPATVLTAASGTEVNLQDLAPSNSRFKFFLFGGFVADQDQRERLHLAAETIRERFMKGKNRNEVDVHVIAHGQEITEMSVALQKATGLDWTTSVIFPLESCIYWLDLCRLHADASDPFELASGALHKSFGIGDHGVVVVVRPDGYVGMLGRLGEGFDKDLDEYFDGFATW